MQSHRTRKASLGVLVTGAVALGLVGSAPVAGQDADVAVKVENAMSAAPPSISANATIVDNALDDTGKFVVLREGNDEWFCFPDGPATPGNDPSCNDKTWLDWTYAFYAGEEPNVTVMGLAYMLAGGSDASNTDPFATEPAPGEDWLTSPPHIMILQPGPLDQAVFSSDHHSGDPWIMWAGTPYEHIMMPTADIEHTQ